MIDIPGMYISETHDSYTTYTSKYFVVSVQAEADPKAGEGLS